MRLGKIKISLILIFCFVLMLGSSQAQVMQCTIKKGSGVNKVDVFIKPDFSNPDPSIYLFQLQFPIAWTNLATPAPTGLIITIDPAFTALFGNYNSAVYSMATHAGTSENYYAVALTKIGSTGTNWVAGTEYKVLTAQFTNVGVAPFALVKVADYLDLGSDLQGSYYTMDGFGNYYRDNTDSRNNFYASPTFSTVGGTAQDGYAQTIDQVVLPIQLLTFNGHKAGPNNILDWKVTCNSTPTATMVLEHSADGRNFNGMYSITKTAQECQSPFDYTDTKPIIGVNYYRLKMIDANGKITYSNIVQLVNMQTGFEIAGIVPNPVTISGIAVLKLSAAKAGTLQMIVTDMAGKKIMAQTQALQAGSNQIPMNFNKLPAGTYHIACYYSDGTVRVAGFVKQ